MKKFSLKKRRIIGAGLILLLLSVAGHAQAFRSGAQPPRSITVQSEPAAVVWLDGVRYGKTDKSGDLAITTVSPGAHTLRVRADGFKEKSQTVSALQKGPVSVSLIKTTDEAELAFQEAERLTGSDRDRSVAAYRRAIKLRLSYPEAYLGLARVLLDAGDPDGAQKAITAARRLRPGFAEASAVEGRIYKEQGDETKAIASFKRAITEGRGFQPEAYAGLGILYKERAEGEAGSGDFDGENENYTEAAKDLKAAIKQLSGAPDSIVIYQLLGLIYERQKKISDAIALYEEFLRLYPDSVEATAVRSFIVQLKKSPSQ